MTEEEKKELDELRKFKETHEASQQTPQEQTPEPQPPTQKKSGHGCLFWVCIIVSSLFFFLVAVANCGGGSGSSSVENFSDDSSYHRILAKNYFKDYIKKNLKDPSSYEEISYTSNYNSYRNCYVVDLKFRAKNSFGGYAVERYIGDVTLKDGSVSFSNVSKLE